MPDPGDAIVLFALTEDRDKSGCCLRRTAVRPAAALSNNRLFHINLRLQIFPIRRQGTLRSDHSTKAKGLVQVCLRSENLRAKTPRRYGKFVVPNIFVFS